MALENNLVVDSDAELKAFLSSILSSEGIVVNINRTFIAYNNGTNRNRVFARCANRMAQKGTDEKFVVIALMCYPALNWILKARDIDAMIEQLHDMDTDGSVRNISEIQSLLENSTGYVKPRLHLEMRKLFFARCQQLVDAVDDAMNRAVFRSAQPCKPARISLAMAMLRGSILDSDPVSAVMIRNNFDGIIEDIAKVGGEAIKELVLQLAPNEGMVQGAEAAYLYHNTEVLLREYSRITHPSSVDGNSTLRLIATAGNQLDASDHKSDDGYILPEEVVTSCYLISKTHGTKRPMTNIMLRGDPSVGKTAGARAIAAGLGLPYTFITCNAGTEMYNLIGDMMPIDSTDSDDSINEELFKDLPTATDISMDPVTAYEAITGVSKADATETECMTELFRKQMKLCSEACGQGFRYVESPLVRAIRNGWVCELQEPSLITRPSVMPGLNGLLDETGCVVLPTGEMLHRHPDCIIISTLNVDLEGCRPLNQSFIDRHHLIVDMKCPNDAVIIKRIKGMTGCGNDVPLQTMVDCVHQIAKKCQTCGATDGNVNSMRSLANWVQAGMLIGDYAKAAEWTVVSGATSDPQTREELMGVVANYSFA